MARDVVLGQHPLLKKEFVDRRIRGLVERQFVADQLFTQTTANALSLKYFVDADGDQFGKETYDEVPEVGEGSNFHRIGLSEDERSAMIRKYGLETVATYEMQKWGTEGQFERAYRKLATNVRKMVDDMAYGTILRSNDIQKATSGGWNNETNGATNMINDLIDMKKGIKDYGYSANTVVIDPATEAMMLKNKDIRDAFRQNNTDVALLRGYIGDFMGLSFVTDENFNEGQVLMLQSKVIGDIADAEALRTKVYNEDSNERTIVRATRFTQAYLTDPKAVFHLSGISS